MIKKECSQQIASKAVTSMEGEESITGWPFYIHFVYSLFLLIVGVPGNALIIFFFQFKERARRRSSYNIYISYMALVDLVVCLFRVIPYSLYLNGIYSKNRELFYILYIIPFVGSDVSLWALWGLSSNRYWKFTRPLRDQLNKAYVAIIPLVVSIVLRYPYDIVTGQNKKDLFITNVILFVCSLIFLNLIPIISIVILYKKTASFLTHQSQFSGSNNNSSHKVMAIKTMRALTISMIVTVAVPRILFVIENGIDVFGGIESEVYEAIECVVYNLNFTNNAINVFIYYRLINNFRRFISPKCLQSNQVAQVSNSKIETDKSQVTSFCQ